MGKILCYYARNYVNIWQHIFRHTNTEAKISLIAELHLKIFNCKLEITEILAESLTVEKMSNAALEF